MSTWAIIPVKRLNEAKSSFGRVLDVESRRRLVIAMLEDMLNAIRKAPSISGTAVVSQDKGVLNFAEINGALGVIEPGLGLNEALKTAIAHVVALGANSVLLLPGDLPLLKTADIENVTAMATAGRDVVIAPSKANGTNALFLRPPDIMNLKFGGESFPLHVAEAMQAGAKPHIYRSETAAFDIDEPEDLLKIKNVGLGTKTHEFLLSQAKSRPYLERK
ncbi:MAG: 2-phospho-L-lactate guanylyltransferase [Methanobacteriota archaeon]